jgi:hypothetical protein
MSIEPPTSSAEQLGQWRALIERIRQGDRSEVLAWERSQLVGLQRHTRSLSLSGSTSSSVTHRL